MVTSEFLVLSMKDRIAPLYLRQNCSVGNSEVIVTDLSHIKHIDIGDLFA